jgi:tetratricopeptide (TPR) repeat protein
MFSRMRAFAPVALVAAVHATALTVAPPLYAQGQGKPAPAQQQQDLIARGQQLFEDQQYEESIQTLSAALLRPSNTKAQKLEIYRLLALNYITLGRKDEAESAVRGLLVQEPEYQLPASESPRFRDFFGAVRKKWEAEGRPGLQQEEEQPAPVSMKHSSPSQVDASTQVDLTAKLEDPKKRVVSVKLYFRAGSSGKFEEQDATLEGASVRTSIPPSAVKPPLVEYYLQGFDKGGMPVVSRGDASAPLRIAVPEPSKGWVLPVVIGGTALTAAAVFIGLAAAGVFKSKSGGPGPGPGGGGNGLVNVTITE